MTLENVVINLDEKNIITCKQCGQGMAVLDEKNGIVRNLDYVAKFLDEHPNTEVMGFEEFKNLTLITQKSKFMNNSHV
ncbi:MAG: hypothetical protein ACXACY_20380 [Candidatus Hodarchaeales archaeon]|jgi:hypothetical protein